MSVPPSLPVDEGLSAPTVKFDAVVRIAWTDGTVSRLTSTLGGCRLPQDAVEDEDGAFYRSFPALREIPALAQLMNGQSDSIEFALSGVPSEIAMLADEQAELAEGARIHVGKVYWDRDWRMIGAARWRWTGFGGTVSNRKTGGRVSGGKLGATVYSISLEAGTQGIRRAGAFLSYWSANQHERRRPGDLFFRLINKISVGYIKSWPRF